MVVNVTHTHAHIQRYTVMNQSAIRLLPVSCPKQDGQEFERVRDGGSPCQDYGDDTLTQTDEDNPGGIAVKCVKNTLFAERAR
ncbi:hypothetical protein P5V15_004007 [Pogonomyrmex californicus]